MESIQEKVLIDILLGNINIDFDFLALKTLLARLQQRIKKNPGSATIKDSVIELQDFFAKFGHLPKTQEEIGKIMRIRIAS